LLFNALEWVGDLVGGVMRGGMDSAIAVGELTMPITKTVAAAGMTVTGNTEMAGQMLSEAGNSALATGKAVVSGVKKTVATGGANVVAAAKMAAGEAIANLGSGDPSRIGRGIYSVGEVVVPGAAGVRTASAAVKGLGSGVKAAAKLGPCPGGQAVGYHATTARGATGIRAIGFRNGVNPGRLGAGGVYVNSTAVGALMEFLRWHPNARSAHILRVRYDPGVNASADLVPFNDLICEFRKV
jgi:hypothetical protein